MDHLDHCGRPYQLVLTKCDLVPRGALLDRLAQAEAAAAARPMALRRVLAVSTAPAAGASIERFKADVAAAVDLLPARAPAAARSGVGAASSGSRRSRSSSSSSSRRAEARLRAP